MAVVGLVVGLTGLLTHCWWTMWTTS